MAGRTGGEEAPVEEDEEEGKGKDGGAVVFIYFAKSVTIRRGHLPQSRGSTATT